MLCSVKPELILSFVDAVTASNLWSYFIFPRLYFDILNTILVSSA